MFRFRRTMSMTLGGACLVLSLAGCQSMLRPLSLFHHKCKCGPVAGAAAECTSCAAPSGGMSLQMTGDVGELPQPLASGYSDPIMLETSPVLLDGQPLPVESYSPTPLPGPGVVVPAPTSPPPGYFAPAPGSFVAPPQVLQPAPSQKPIAPPKEQASASLPAPAYHVQAPVAHPSPPPRRARVSAAPAPSSQPIERPSETAPKPIQTPEPKQEPAPPAQPLVKAKPGGLTVNVTGSPSVVELGDEVRFEISVRNQGESAIEKVELMATLSDNLQGKVIRPDGSGSFEGQKVTFVPIQPLTPMEMKFILTAVVAKVDGGNGKLTVEAKSPILTSGPLKNEASVTIGNEDAEPKN